MQVLIQYQLYQELQDVLGKYTFTKLSLNLVTEEANIRITNKWEELTTPPPKKNPTTTTNKQKNKTQDSPTISSSKVHLESFKDTVS